MIVKGAVFDMDGLILDTEKLYQRFWREASSICGYEMPQTIALQLRSLDKNLAKKLLNDFFGQGYDYNAVKQERIRLMSDYINKNGIQSKKGVRELVDYLRKNNVKIAVATATNYERANQHLTLAGVRECFDNIICACELPHGKPYPDVYLFACEKLELNPKECIALEDSPNGIKAAYGAGCIPILVPDGDNFEEEVSDIIYARVPSLADVPKLLDDMQTKL